MGHWNSVRCWRTSTIWIKRATGTIFKSSRFLENHQKLRRFMPLIFFIRWSCFYIYIEGGGFWYGFTSSWRLNVGNELWLTSLCMPRSYSCRFFCILLIYLKFIISVDIVLNSSDKKFHCASNNKIAIIF